ncbi:LysR family transcriptional regulator [Martelella lutilitoris]|uniref:LysR family transcriptional regulator n=1 Tax=Martelella lutilitoris TaxID=2583532 RepID=A0A7T7KLJ4_9HYPH|nr:LysR family transcriptional regulator [Martelella lutilitoris]QQM29944.1 LysR family transcriptional regulator [Martelella lutilitoris]
MDTLTRMRAFIDVVEAEGFSAAARKTGRSKALLSKYVRELEDDLGALLLNRTTRQFSLTEAGHIYFRRAAEIVQEVDNLSDAVRANNTDLRGRLRISVPRTFVDAPAGQSLIDFAKAHNELTLEIVAEDRFVDLVEEGYDVAVRITRLEDSTMIARKLADSINRVCASPAYLASLEKPLDKPADLAHHPVIVDTNPKSFNTLRFINPQDGTGFSVPIHGPIEVNSPMVTMRGALSGLGIALLPDFVARRAIDSGELVSLFDEYLPQHSGIYAVFPHRRYLPVKVRSFVDFLSKWFRENDCEKH